MGLKIKFVFFSIFISATIHAQVGINTTDPATTLEVSAGSSGDLPVGIIAPHQSLQQLLDRSEGYTSYQVGAFVYVNSIDAETDAKTANITKVGYYYFDGSLWQPFSSSDNKGGWSLLGNEISTTHGENYLGTNNDADLVFKTNSTEQMTILANGNVGVGVSDPTNKLHVKASTDPVRIEGLGESTSTGDRPIVVGDDGILKKGDFPIVDIVPDDIGTAIALNGKIIVAQEITVLMTKDFSFPLSGQTPNVIGNLTNVIIDNHNSFKSDATSNSFTVDADGVYLITINVQLKDLAGTGYPVVGVWCDNCPSNVVGNPIGSWVARVSDFANTDLQTYTLITAINMYKDNTYSFRVAGSAPGSIPWESRGYTGGGPISFYSVKRLK